MLSASQIDHTNLKETASDEDILKLCEEAVQYGFRSVCVRLNKLALAAKFLKGKKSYAITVIDFPLGKGGIEEKVKEANLAIALGAHELDMVMNYEALKKKEYKKVFDEIKAVVDVAKRRVKVILETCNLDRDEKVIACALSKAAGATDVKTSTGFGKGGATVEDVALMRQVVGSNMGVKASGGIRTYKDAINMINAGADRLGTSASITIIKGEL